MSTRDDVDRTALTLGWSFLNGTYLRGDKCIQVDYSAAGNILDAIRYRFFKVDDLHFEERAVGKHKKEAVVSWLAS